MTAGIVELTQQQFRAFITDKLDGRGPCRVQEDLAFAALAGTSVVPNARLFLAALDGNGAGLTQLQPAAGGRAALFRATLAQYNLAYLDRFNMPEVFAPQISLILYLIGQFCTDWREAGALMRSVTIPTKELTEPKYPELPIAAFEARVLRYLCWFGLMEKARPAANDDWQQPRLYRKTPLYDRMLRFVGLG
ncbi:MAG TPA: hypothetical protein VH684_24420 [Xanthobacteraceae bacterium]|jgi:hypothetical protein